jgi:hypothetical protein
MSKRPYSRMFYFPNEDLEATIDSGLVAERVINELWGDNTSSDDFFEVLEVIELRILRVFNSARDPKTSKVTDNFIVGARGTLDSLTHWVESRFGYKGYVVHENDLPYDIRKLKSDYCEKVAHQVRLYLVKTVLETLQQEGDIWFDTCGTWTVRQSKIDKYEKRRTRASRTRKSMKVDLRNYHGRNRGQSKRRGIPAGTSIGYVRSRTAA